MDLWILVLNLPNYLDIRNLGMAKEFRKFIRGDRISFTPNKNLTT